MFPHRLGEEDESRAVLSGVLAGLTPGKCLSTGLGRVLPVVEMKPGVMLKLAVQEGFGRGVSTVSPVIYCAAAGPSLSLNPIPTTGRCTPMTRPMKSFRLKYREDQAKSPAK